MLNIYLIAWPIVGFIVLLVISKIKLTKWKYYDGFNLAVFIITNLVVVSFFILNYLVAYSEYTKNVLEAPKELVAEVILYDLKVLLLFMLFNLSYIFLAKKR